MRKSECLNKLLENLYSGINVHKTEFLIGLIDVDEDTYCEVLKFAAALIKKDVYVLREEKSAIISISLVLFAIREYQNGQYWSEFATRLDLEELEVMKIGKKSLKEFCEKNDLYFHYGNKNKGYVTSILIHAILPDSNMPKFFEFLQDLYFKDLEEDYIDQEVEELIQYMQCLFTKYIEDDDISLVVQGSKMTLANQQLPRAFRIAFVRSASIVAPILERLLYYINQSNYGEMIEYLENDRFDKNFEHFRYLVKERYYNLSKSSRGVKRPKKFQKAQYYYEHGKLYLQIPKQIISSEYIEYNIFLEVTYDNSLVHSEKVSLTKSRLFFKTEQTTVCLTNFYSQLSFQLVCETGIIYTSGDLMHREFIIFDLEGNEIHPKNLTDDTVKVITYTGCEVLSDDAQIDVCYTSNYKISTIFLNEESLLLINDKILSTNVARIKNEIRTKDKLIGVYIKNSSNSNFEVYSNIPEIRIRIPYLKSIDDFIISINNKNYPLSSISNFETKLISDGSGDELGVINIYDQILMENNPAKLIIREKGSNRLYIENNIFILKSLSYEFDKKYYFKEKIAEILRFKSEEIELIKEIELPIKINIKKNKYFRAEFSYNSNIYQLIVELPILHWRLGNLSSETNRSVDIWWEDVDDLSFFVKYPNDFSSKLYVITSTSYEEIQGKVIGDEYRYSLEHLFRITNQESITVGVKLNEKEERIMEIHFKPVIRDFSVSYYDRNNLIKGLYAQWKYIGSGELHFDVIYSPTRKVIKHYVVNGSDEYLMDKNIELYYNEHEVEIYQVIEDDFFTSCSEKRILFNESFIVGDSLIICTKNKILKGTFCIIDSKNYEISNFYLKDLKFSKKRGFYEASGFYIIKDRCTGTERKWFFVKYNPFIIKPKCTDNDMLFEIVDRDKCGLIYDIQTKHVNHITEKYNKDRYKLIDAIQLEIIK